MLIWIVAVILFLPPFYGLKNRGLEISTATEFQSPQNAPLANALKLGKHWIQIRRMRNCLVMKL